MRRYFIVGDYCELGFFECVVLHLLDLLPQYYACQSDLFKLPVGHSAIGMRVSMHFHIEYIWRPLESSQSDYLQLGLSIPGIQITV